MRETRFIEQNKEKWTEYENMLKERKPDVEKIYGLFYSISDDLAFARSNYPNRSVRVYLNNLARNLFRNVYAGKRFTLRSAFQFWKSDLPLALYYTRFEQLTALLVFIVAGLIGIVSCMSDDEFAKGILGESYIRMTLENIHNGKPMAVYDESDPFNMFLKIATNNLRVCFTGFATGILGGLGTLYTLLYNGIMVGTFQFFFAKYNLLWSSFLTIWMHGALEISSIVIGSGAGFTLGRGLLFPGTYSRMQSLLLASRRSIVIMIGISPVIVVAAYIESFLTRHYDLPVGIKLALILASFGFILFYFVVYPFMVGKNRKEIMVQSDGLTYIKPVAFRTDQIYNAGQISGFALKHLGTLFQKTWWITILISGLYMGAVGWIQNAESVYYETSTETGFWNTIFFFTESVPVMVLHMAGATFLVLYSFYQLLIILKSVKPVSFFGILRRFGIQTFLVCFALSVLIYLPIAYRLLYLLVIPFFYVWQGMLLVASGSPVTVITKTWNFTLGSFGKTLGSFLIFFSLGTISILLTSSTLMGQAFDLIYWNISTQNSETIRLIFKYLPSFIGYLCVLLTSQLMLTSTYFLAHTLIETNDAPGLLNRIRQLIKE